MHKDLVDSREKTVTLNERIEKYRWKYFVALFLVGIFNNNGYTMVQGAADDLATQFGQESFMGFFLFFMILFGAGSRLVNGACCVKVSHMTRILIVTIFTFGSFILIAVCCFNEDIPAFFWVAVGASVFTGISQSFGEAIFLGFLKGYPSYMVGYVSCGTGFAGPFATAFPLGLKALGLSNQAIFLIEAPWILAYYCAFRWLVNQKKKYPFIPEVEAQL